MAWFKNNTKGARGIALRGGGHKFVQPGESIRIDGAKVKRMPSGLVEVDPPELGDLHDEPADLSAGLAVFDGDGDGKPGGSKPADPPALSSMTKAELTAQAEAEGVDLEAITGTGASGNVVADDIRAAIEARRAEAAAD